MKDTQDIVACVVDHGLFVPIARRLARDYAKVFYYTPHEKSFPTVRDRIGDGYPDIVRVNSPWQVKDECQLYVFPDVGFADMQAELRAQGYAVWGGGHLDRLETDRGQFLRVLERQTDLPVPPFEKIVGLSKLREHLRDKTDLWIKISGFRGDWETLHWRSWAEDEIELDLAAMQFGPVREQVPFYVFDPIHTDIEDGVDSWCIDGQFPQTILHGMEAKDHGYICAVQALADLPEEVRCVNEAFGPILNPYRGFFSTEVRITPKGDSYFVDPTCRAGSPPSQVLCELVANLGEVIWQGANGILVEPEPAARFGAQAMLSFKGDRNYWRGFRVKPDLDQWLKCGNSLYVDGAICLVPDPDDASLHWLVGIGNSIAQAIDHLKDNAALLPDGVSCDLAPLADLLREIQEANEQGMAFTEAKVPEPESVLE